MIPGLGRPRGEGKWQPTPVFLPGKFHGQRSLVVYSPWGRRVTHNLATKQQQQQSLINLRYVLAQATITKYHRLGSLTKKHGSQFWKLRSPKSRHQVGACFLVYTPLSSHYVHTGLFLCLGFPGVSLITLAVRLN